MKLGILVNTDKHLKDIVGITKSAISKGHEVTIFIMDDGSRLLGAPLFAELCGMQSVKMNFCDYGAKKIEVPTEGLPDELAPGSQYDNALMSHECDRVIVL